VEAGSQLDQRRDSPFDPDLAGGWLQDAAHQLHRGTLPRPVVPDKPQGFAAPHLEADVAQRPQLLPLGTTEQVDDQFLE